MKALAKLFAKPSARQLAQAELDDAQRELLTAKSAEEYARNLASYHAQRISRLRAFLSSEVPNAG